MDSGDDRNFDNSNDCKCSTASSESLQDDSEACEAVIQVVSVRLFWQNIKNLYILINTNLENFYIHGKYRNKDDCIIVPRPNSNQCNNLDRETEKFVLLLIQAEDLPRYDSKLTDNSKVINITILDINDNAPEFNIKTEYMEVRLLKNAYKKKRFCVIYSEKEIFRNTMTFTWGLLKP